MLVSPGRLGQLVLTVVDGASNDDLNEDTLSWCIFVGSKAIKSFAAFASTASLPFSGAGGMGIWPSASADHSRTSEKSTEDKNPLKATASDCVSRAILTSSIRSLVWGVSGGKEACDLRRVGCERQTIIYCGHKLE